MYKMSLVELIYIKFCLFKFFFLSFALFFICIVLHQRDLSSIYAFPTYVLAYVEQVGGGVGLSYLHQG